MPARLLILDDQSLRQLAATPAVLAEFPNLRPLTAPKPRGCSACANRALQEELQRVKVGLAVMPDDKKRRLKELASAEQIRLLYRGPTGKTIEHTF